MCTVELAGFGEGKTLREMFGMPEMVPALVEEERPEPDAEFWKQNAQVYLIEQVPFGVVDVQVPRNCRDSAVCSIPPRPCWRLESTARGRVRASCCTAVHPAENRRPSLDCGR